MPPALPEGGEKKPGGIAGRDPGTGDRMLGNGGSPPRWTPLRAAGCADACSTAARRAADECCSCWSIAPSRGCCAAAAAAAAWTWNGNGSAGGSMEDDGWCGKNGNGSDDGG
jgi:hypothetical protein